MSLSDALSNLNQKLKALRADTVLVVRDDGINVFSSEKKHSLEQGVLLTGLMHALQGLNSLLKTSSKNIFNEDFFIQKIELSGKDYFVLITYQKSKISSKIRYDLHNFFLTYSLKSQEKTGDRTQLLFANITENEIEDAFKSLRID